MSVEEAQKVLNKAIWSCIVEASSMNVVMSGAEVNAAIRELKAAIEAAERARVETRLIAIYPEHHASVALVCDEAIDRSGAMLGRIRAATREPVA